MRSLKLIIYFILASNGFSGQTEEAQPVENLDVAAENAALVEFIHSASSSDLVRAKYPIKRKFLNDILGNPLLGGCGSGFYLKIVKEDLGSITTENKIAFKADQLLQHLHFNNFDIPFAA